MGDVFWVKNWVFGSFFESFVKTRKSEFSPYLTICGVGEGGQAHVISSCYRFLSISGISEIRSKIAKTRVCGVKFSSCGVNWISNSNF